MSYLICLFVSFGMLVAVYAFARERRLRIALQALLTKLLQRIRNRSHVSPEADTTLGNVGDHDRRL